jgi:hypothetical protein
MSTAYVAQISERRQAGMKVGRKLGVVVSDEQGRAVIAVWNVDGAPQRVASAVETARTHDATWLSSGLPEALRSEGIYVAHPSRLDVTDLEAAARDEYEGSGMAGRPATVIDLGLPGPPERELL